MKKLLPVIFFVISHSLMAQKLSWSVNIAPTISYRTYPYATQQERMPLATAGEKAMYTFDFGVDLRSYITPRFSVGSAVLYSLKGFANTLLSTTYQSERIGPEYLLNYQHHYLEIPVFITYDLWQHKKFTLYPLAGVVNSMLLSEKNRVVNRQGDLDPEILQLVSSPYLRAKGIHQLGLYGGVGITTQVNRKTLIGIEAQTKMMLSPIRDIRSQTDRYLYSSGINFRFIRTLSQSVQK